MINDLEIQQMLLGHLDAHDESVGSLINNVATEGRVQQFRVAKNLYALSEAGKVELVDLERHSSIVDYLQSQYAWWFWAVVGIDTLTLVSVYTFPQTGPLIYIRYALGLAFIAFLPGYALTESLYSSKRDLSVLERSALSLGLSLTVVPLIAVLLYYVNIAINLNTMAISLSVFALALSFVAARRKFEEMRKNLEVVNQ